MADIKCTAFFSTFCLFMSVISSVLCQFDLGMVGGAIPGFGGPPVTDCTYGCPPAWADLLQTYGHMVSSVTGNPSSPLCRYVSEQRLVTPCINKNNVPSACGSARNSLFCCCPVAAQTAIINGCFRGNITFQNVQNACVPMDISPWGGELLGAFQQSAGLGRK